MRQAKKHDDLIYDLGLHQGEDTSFYLAKGFRVVAFEADPDLISKCRENFSTEINSGRLTLIEGAIVENPITDTVTFYKNNNVTVWGTIDPKWKDRNARMGWESEEIKVPVVDLGACIEKYGIPYYIKIDIEGADRFSLQKLGEFEKRPNYISIESSKISLRDIYDELAILEGLGYCGFQAVQQATIPGLNAPRPAKEGNDINYEMKPDSSGVFGKELPGKWHTRRRVYFAYFIVFFGYWLFGNDSFMRTNRFAKRIWRLLQRVFRRPIPGWYDTHARHKTVHD
ncbi:MAG: FkbM family methyltransferase [Pseudomonadota bacterium]|nr:FkbM family methyltransferase [Pseudomonadota bacterium]